MIPKFLMADNFEVEDKVFIVHTKFPVCFIECSVDDFNTEQEIHWIDEEIEDPEEYNAFLKEAEAYYEHEFSLLDEEFEDD